MAKPIPVYLGHDENDQKRLLADVKAAYDRAAKRAATESSRAEEPELKPVEEADIPPSPDLIGIDASVYRQVMAALRAGKKHILFYGPPGTGKTTLAQYVAAALHGKWAMITGSSDWTSQDVIGGYQPTGAGKLRFVPGVLLQNFDRPLIIDELNRCDIDKVIGPLFTILSDQPSTLPYRLDADDDNSPFYRILPKPHGGRAKHEFAPEEGWRLIATINTLDKAALYQMSFALSRRFAWIYVDVPRDVKAFIGEFAKKNGLAAEDEDTTTSPLADIWQAVNDIRPIGPAPIIDMARTLKVLDAAIDLFSPPTPSQGSLYVEVFGLYLLPLLDGISTSAAESLWSAITAAAKIAPDQQDGQEMKRRLVALCL